MKLGGAKKKYNSYASDKKKKKNLKVISITIGAVISVVLIYQYLVMPYYGNQVRNNTIAELTASEGDYVKVLVLNKDIEKGSEINVNEDIIEITQNSKLIPTNYIESTSNLSELVTRIKLSANTVLSQDMVVKMEEQITDPIKNQDYDWIKVHAFLKQGDYVDIHFREKDGTDTIVASKKKIINLNGRIFAINHDEKERAYINNATVKASLVGGELYTSIYPDPENQNAAKVTYVMDKEIEEKIKKDPNIVKESVESIKNTNTTNKQSDDSNAKYVKEVKKPSFTGGN